MVRLRRYDHPWTVLGRDRVRGCILRVIVEGSAGRRVLCGLTLAAANFVKLLLLDHVTGVAVASSCLPDVDCSRIYCKGDRMSSADACQEDRL